jgi:hypothetical protein
MKFYGSPFLMNGRGEEYRMNSHPPCFSHLFTCDMVNREYSMVCIGRAGLSQVDSVDCSRDGGRRRVYKLSQLCL